MKPENRNLLDYEVIGQRIKNLRLNKNMTLKELGEKANVELQTISKYEHGSKRLGLTSLLLISEALEVSPMYILYGESFRTGDADGAKAKVLDLMTGCTDADQKLIASVVETMVGNLDKR